MNIGQLARQAGVAIDTIRYYERQHLLPSPPRSPSGYRRYQAEDATRLNFIRRAKALGFTLDEIRELLSLTASANTDMAAMKTAATAKLEVVEQRLAELARMRDALRTLVDACPGHGELERCPILNALVEDQA
ncbi:MULTISPECIES: MerR family transcriptional regulator [unclassified Pseudoxanthomonas]|jgi:Hg(II)-responsive transcriptional regulator|uniref:MerR family transcriptional regulator n=1 Tax=unclassified Pseudoxanthomonas TaxID=2645906 RepID=UPI0030771A01